MRTRQVTAGDSSIEAELAKRLTPTLIAAPPDPAHVAIKPHPELRPGVPRPLEHYSPSADVAIESATLDLAQASSDLISYRRFSMTEEPFFASQLRPWP